jgi:hypothetical protein
MTRPVEASSVASRVQGRGTLLAVQRAHPGATDRSIVEPRIKMLEMGRNWLYIEVGRHWP